jgi:hypothetical protein
MILIKTLLNGTFDNGAKIKVLVYRDIKAFED